MSRSVTGNRLPTLSAMHVRDVRIWIFVAVVLAMIGFLIYATIAAGGF